MDGDNSKAKQDYAKSDAGVLVEAKMLPWFFRTCGIFVATSVCLYILGCGYIGMSYSLGFALGGCLISSIRLLGWRDKYNIVLKGEKLRLPVKQRIGFRSLTVSISDVEFLDGVRAALNGSSAVLKDGRLTGISRKFFSKDDVDFLVREISLRQDML